MNNLPTSGRIPTRRYHVFSPPSASISAAKEEPVTEKKPEPMPPSSPAPVPPLHLQRGLTLYAQGNTLGALWAFSEGIDLEPNNPLGHYLCGLAFQAQGHGRQARDEWETVLTLTADATGSGGEAPPRAETQWVRGLVQRLLASGSVDAEERLPAREMPAREMPAREMPAREMPAREMPASEVSAREMPASEVSATGDVPQVGTEGAGIRSQGELEAAIRDAVQRHGGCYVQDRSVAAVLRATTEEQVVGWQQSFSAREGLACHPHRKTINQVSRQQEGRQQEGHCDGVVFKRRETPKARETASV